MLEIPLWHAGPNTKLSSANWLLQYTSRQAVQLAKGGQRALVVLGQALEGRLLEVDPAAVHADVRRGLPLRRRQLAPEPRRHRPLWQPLHVHICIVALHLLRQAWCGIRSNSSNVLVYTVPLPLLLLPFCRVPSSKQ